MKVSHDNNSLKSQVKKTKRQRLLLIFIRSLHIIQVKYNYDKRHSSSTNRLTVYVEKQSVALKDYWCDSN